MIWLIFLGATVYTLSLLSLGAWAMYRLQIKPQKSLTTQPSNTLDTVDLKKPVVQSGALKSITPLERSLEDSKEIKERVEYLLK